MKRIFAWLFAGAIFAGVCVAQGVQSESSGTSSQGTSVSAEKSGAQATSSASLTASQAGKLSDNNGTEASGASQLELGSTVHAELMKPVDAHKCKVGDEVLAKTTYDVKSNGHVVVPKGSKLIGHVTEVKARTKDQATSSVGIAFDHAMLKDGKEMPLALTIQAIGRGRASAAAMEDDSMANAGTIGSGEARAPGGMLAGARSTAGGIVNTADRSAGAAVNTGGTVAGGAGAASGTVNGSLSSTSEGVVGMPGLSLATDTSASAHASVVSSQSSNVRLESGTEMVLRVKQ